jgi:hypothetical protein
VSQKVLLFPLPRRHITQKLQLNIVQIHVSYSITFEMIDEAKMTWAQKENKLTEFIVFA